MIGTLLANRKGKHNKYYLIISEDMDNPTLNCSYGRIETLKEGRISNSKTYKRFEKYSHKFLRNKKIAKGYKKIFEVEANEDQIFQAAFDWVRTGVHKGVPTKTEFIPWYEDVKGVV